VRQDLPSKLTELALLVGLAFVAACGTIGSYRQVDQPLGPQLTSGIGGTVFHLNKQSDLPNAFGGRDIYGGKVDRGFAEMKLAGIEDQTVILDVVDVSRQSSETTMDRYKHLMRPGLVNVDVQQSVNVSGSQGPVPTRIRLDTRKQRDIVISGIRVTFVEVQPYGARYTLEDLQPQ
jgi:hypothetical protein